MHHILKSGTDKSKGRALTRLFFVVLFLVSNVGLPVVLGVGEAIMVSVSVGVGVEIGVA